MRNCYFDTETLGLYGPPVILQAQFDYHTERHGTEAFLYDLWRQPVRMTLDLIEEIVECRCVAHNITFDWQKISQFYCALVALSEQEGDHVRPIDFLARMPDLIFKHRSDFCLKPKAAVCTLLLCQKQIGGAALATKEIRVRKIPSHVAPYVAGILNQNTQLPEILFARRKTDERWSVAQSDDGEGWSDVALKFAPSSALKDVARLVLGVEETQKIGQDFRPPVYPYEVGYAPYAVMLNNGPDPWTHTFYHKQSKSERVAPLWPLLLQEHLDFWTTKGTDQYRYALDDIVLLKMLDEHLGKPDTDFDSEIACQVASVRVAGMTIDEGKLAVQVDASAAVVAKAEVNVDSHVQVKRYIGEALDDMEALIIADGCDKAKLKAMTTSLVLDEEEDCECDDPSVCQRCEGKGVVGPGPMPVVRRAEHILKIRKHRKRLQLYTKLKVAKGCFPSFRVIGAKSGRMSGADGLNYHGIDGTREIREVFTLTDGTGLEEGWVVSGGDMNSQELAIAAAVMNDINLEDDIGKGKSLHGVFAASASGLPYDQIMKNKEDKATPEAAWYKKAKICVYAILYGAASFNIATTLGCTVEEAEQTIADFFAKYPYMAETRKMVKKSLEALRADSEGRLVVCKPQQQHIESIFGFRRSFDAEFAVMNILFKSMHHWRKLCQDELADIGLDAKVIRKEAKGPQTVKSAVSSALFGAVFSLQGKILRAALNHLIQSAGRTCTLRVQKRVWDEVQPVGIHPFRIKLMSVHDELATACHKRDAAKVAFAVQDEMRLLCKDVPLLSLDWAVDVGSWYGVKAAEENLIRCGWEG